MIPEKEEGGGRVSGREGERERERRNIDVREPSISCLPNEP